MTEKIKALRGISALHARQPIVDLRSSGKGANRTILDCCSAGWGAESGFCRRGVSRAPENLLGGVFPASSGRFGRLQTGKGLES
jgi:hypothetical protein